MDVELKSLEEKINQFVALCHRLRTDNHELRQQLASAHNDNKQLNEKIGDAKTRLESVLSQIPEE
jgi:cell division protein ZapB